MTRAVGSEKSTLPKWLLELPNPSGRNRSKVSQGTLRLFYPASPYDHKNHDLLWRTFKEFPEQLAEFTLIVTMDRVEQTPSSIKYVGTLERNSVVDYYLSSDALIFPSKLETLGLPLIEAMFFGLPIVCSDRDFSRTLCGDGAIYFDPDSTESLKTALFELKTRLQSGWIPDWSKQLEKIDPDEWRNAKNILSILESWAPAITL